MPKIVVVGSINLDLVVTADRFPAPGETVPGLAFRRFSGGKGLNQAVAAARMGAPVAFVGAVGDDPFGAALVDELAAEGIDTRAVTTAAGVPTGTALITVAHGENTIVVVPGANAAVAAEPAAAAVAQGDRVIAPLEVPLPAIRAAFEAARAAGGSTLLNAAPALAEARTLLPLVDTLVVNETELAVLEPVPFGSKRSERKGPAQALESGAIPDRSDDSIRSGNALAPPGLDAGDGDAALEAAARSLLAFGIGTVVVTLGAAGVLAVTAAETIRLAGHAVVPIDTTGAGDCFVGALAAALWSGAGLEAALARANAAAALSVQVPGAAPSMPRAADVDAFLAARA